MLEVLDDDISSVLAHGGARGEIIAHGVLGNAIFDAVSCRTINL